MQTTVRSAGLTFVNVHLESGKDGDLKRLQALKTITNTCPTSALAIVGDTNMRVADEESLEPIGLIGARPPRPTWDTKRNKYRDQ